MEFKGTQGKWKSTKMDIVKQDVYLIIDEDRYQVASVDNRFIKDDETVKANARLISQAPEMFEMLTKVNDLFIRRALPTEREVNQFAKDIEELLTKATTV